MRDTCNTGLLPEGAMSPVSGNDSSVRDCLSVAGVVRSVRPVAMRGCPSASAGFEPVALRHESPWLRLGFREPVG